MLTSMFSFFLDYPITVAINGASSWPCSARASSAARQRRADRILFGAVTAVLLLAPPGWRASQTLPEFRMDFASPGVPVLRLRDHDDGLYALFSIVVLSRTSDHSRGGRRRSRVAARACRAWTSSSPPTTRGWRSRRRPSSPRSPSTTPISACGCWTTPGATGSRPSAPRWGAHYVTRADNTHAKAGNLNNGLGVSAEGGRRATSGARRRLRPHRNILLRTIGLFSDPGSAWCDAAVLLQRRPDPVQPALAGMLGGRAARVLRRHAAGQGCLGHGFCIGTSFVVRRDLLGRIGGFPTGTVTEDIHLTYRLLPLGYVTRWLNERLSIGLSAEGLPEYISQRSAGASAPSRWP